MNVKDVWMWRWIMSDCGGYMVVDFIFLCVSLFRCDSISVYEVDTLGMFMFPCRR